MIEEPWEAERGLAEEFTVRSPKRTDLDDIHKVYLESWKDTYEGYGLGWSNKKILLDLHSDKMPLSSWILVEYDGEIVGFLRHSICLRHLEKIFVHPDYMKTGAGYTLMKEYFWKVSHEVKFATPIFLEVYEANERAKKFFEGFGYHESGLVWTSPTSRRDVIIMEKLYAPLR